MIWKLLRKNISPWQIGGYAVATFVGLVIVMAAIQFYNDIGRALAGGSDSNVQLVSPRNLVISKPVGLFDSFGSSSTEFTADEIDEIRSQSWCGDVSAFQASDFEVYASVSMGGRHMATALFFESVPDRLIDGQIEGFEFDSVNPEIPIVLSKDYLTLYNFGFAASGRMPMISESIISSVPLTVSLSGERGRGVLPARIVGFSSWLNTIAVPQEFMDWAHRHFGSDEIKAPSRLIVTVADPTDPAVHRFFEDRDYQIAGPEDDLGRTSYLLKLVTTSIAAVGGIITLLALFILVLSLFLLIQKNGRAIRGLLLLGYRPSQVSGCYMRLVAVVNVSVLVLASVAMLAVERVWTPAVGALGATVTSPLASVAAGAALIAAVTAVNCMIIRRLVRRYF